MRVRASNVNLRGDIWSLAYSEEGESQRGHSQHSTALGTHTGRTGQWCEAQSRHPCWPALLEEVRPGGSACGLLIIFTEKKKSPPPRPVSSTVAPLPVLCPPQLPPPRPVSSTVTLFFCSVFHLSPQFKWRTGLCLQSQEMGAPDLFPFKNHPTPLHGDGSQGPVHLLPFTGCLLSSVFLFLQGVLHTPSDMVYQQSMCLLQPWKL